MKPGEFFNPYRIFRGVFVPAAVAGNQRLSQGARMCYGQLVRYGGQNGIAWPSQKKLAEAMGVRERQVRNYIDELEREALIVSDRRGLGRTQLYHFAWHPSFDEENEKETGTTMPVRPAKECRSERHNSAGPSLEIHSRDSSSTPRTPPLSGGAAPPKKLRRQDKHRDRLEQLIGEAIPELQP